AGGRDPPRAGGDRGPMAASILGRHKHVADPAYGADGGGVGRIGFDLAAQARDTKIDGAVERLHFAMRGDLEQPIAIEGAVGIFGKHLEQVEFAGGQTLLTAITAAAQDALLEIKHAPPHAHARARWGWLAADAAQDAFHTRQQLARLEWLGDVVVGTGLQADHAVDRIGGNRHHNDADAATFLAQPARKGEAVLARQANVEENKLRQFTLDQLPERRPAIDA